MGFRIFAAGTNNFHYDKKGCEDGSTFDAIDLISTLQSLDFTSLGGAAKSYANSKTDPTNDPTSIVDVMKSIVYKEMVHNLSNAVCFLSMKSTSGGWIYIDAVETSRIWTDTRRTVKYSFDPGYSPSAEFIKAIAKPLEETDMDNFGVLQQLSIVLSRYANHIDDSMTPMINISLTN